MDLFTKEDFAEMFFPIYGKRGLGSVKELGLVKSLNRLTVDLRDETVKYFVYMYDKGSPLPKRFRDVTKRKEIAAKMAGFDLKMDHNYLTTLYSMEKELWVEIVHEILTVQKSMLWRRIVLDEQMFDEYQYHMLKRVEDGGSDKQILDAVHVKNKLRETLRDIEEGLEQMYARFYGDDETLRKVISQVNPMDFSHVQ